MSLLSDGIIFVAKETRDFVQKQEQEGNFKSNLVFGIVIKHVINMTTRTYNPSVRVGNWNEDIQLEEVGIYV